MNATWPGGEGKSLYRNSDILPAPAPLPARADWDPEFDESYSGPLPNELPPVIPNNGTPPVTPNAPPLNLPPKKTGFIPLYSEPQFRTISATTPANDTLRETLGIDKRLNALLGNTPVVVRETNNTNAPTSTILPPIVVSDIDVQIDQSKDRASMIDEVLKANNSTLPEPIRKQIQAVHEGAEAIREWQEVNKGDITIQESLALLAKQAMELSKDSDPAIRKIGLTLSADLIAGKAEVEESMSSFGILQQNAQKKFGVVQEFIEAEQAENTLLRTALEEVVQGKRSLQDVPDISREATNTWQPIASEAPEDTDIAKLPDANRWQKARQDLQELNREASNALNTLRSIDAS
jgi:hypothetical protein